MSNYIPPHKRQLKDGAKALEGSSPNPRALVHKFQQNLNLSGSYKSESCSSERVMRNGKDASLGGRYAYAKSCHSRLCIVDSTEEEEEHQYPGAIRLQHITPKSSLHKELGNHGSIPYVLVSSHKKTGTKELNKDSSIENPLISVAEQILPHLLAFQNKSVEGRSKEFEEGKMCFVARFGKILFHTPNSLSCKCTATGVGGLELQKIETNNVRHVIVDIACVEKDLDLRLMLSTRKIVTEPTDEEKHDLEKLIKSAVVDRNEKGGMRFPLGNESIEGRYRVVGMGQMTSRAYKNPSIRVKLNEADRYDFITSTAEVTNHVVLKMTSISEKLKDDNLEAHQLAKMLEGNMNIIWNHFLSLECRFT
ncbi:hypothetical protein MKX01_041112 [Papaver californicum]|nr:hypothetical protein MKX01_041112 [Papaver californicum]